MMVATPAFLSRGRGPNLPSCSLLFPLRKSVRRTRDELRGFRGVSRAGRERVRVGRGAGARVAISTDRNDQARIEGNSDAGFDRGGGRLSGMRTVVLSDVLPGLKFT